MKKLHVYTLSVSLRMKPTCTNPTYFKKILDTISILVEDVNLQCNEKGIFIQGLDPSKVSMFKLILKSSFFETYECNSIQRDTNLILRW